LTLTYKVLHSLLIDPDDRLNAAQIIKTEILFKTVIAIFKVGIMALCKRNIILNVARVLQVPSRSSKKKTTGSLYNCAFFRIIICMLGYTVV
jgi:hypothetical protein